jgi:hypothetical protein
MSRIESRQIASRIIAKLCATNILATAPPGLFSGAANTATNVVG